MENWIKCSERMPEDTQMVLAFSQGEIVAAYWNWVVNPIDYKNIELSLIYRGVYSNTSHTGNHYPSRRRSDTMDYLLLYVGVVIWVRYLC